MLFRSVSQSRYGGAAVGGVPGALIGGALGVASSLLGGLFGKHNTNKINQMNYQIMQELMICVQQVSMLCLVMFLLVATLVVVVLLLLLNLLK